MSRPNAARADRILFGLVLTVLAASLVACRSKSGESENDDDQEFEMAEGDPDMLADSPFDDKAFNDVIGIGGGAGGKFGGRYGSRRNLRARGEVYDEVPTSGYRLTTIDPSATFSVDVDTGSYSNVRRILGEDRLPEADAVRVEELLNYFHYNDPTPTDDTPFAVTIETASCPWNTEHRLARIGLKTTAIDVSNRQPCNLVFLLDVSGSMNSADKLPLLKRAMHMLVENMTGRDRVAIVVYAGAAGLVLPSTVCSNKAPVLEALDRLEAGGSTAGAAGIQLAYQIAREHFIPDGINRLVLATDGDFNVGTSDKDELVALVEAQAASGVALTVLGFGTGNLKEATLEQLADHGDGNYAYIDQISEARKVLVEELGATLATVAADVKLQVSFDPARIAAHRLIGYENRRLEHADFADDKKDAGEIGAGHGVTALFELVPVGGDLEGLELAQPDPEALSDSEWSSPGSIRIDVRFKPPGEETSQLVSFDANDTGVDYSGASDDLRFAASVAWFGELLRKSSHVAGTELIDVRRLVEASLGEDQGGHRLAFLHLIDKAAALRDLSR